jgi:DNA repair photolyase
VINPYRGCQHGCSYCYARFMKKFTGHMEPWGEFVDVKINAAELLNVEIKKKKPGRVWVSGVCDPYQPLEARYKLTQKCLEILVQYQWPVRVQTRSPLVLRDIDILKNAGDIQVSMTVPTASEEMRGLFEPHAPSIKARLQALEELHNAGIQTYVMIAPLLPGAEDLANALRGKAECVMIDRMNYSYANWVYKKYKLEDKLSDDYFFRTSRELSSAFEKQGLDCQVF